MFVKDIGTKNNITLAVFVKWISPCELIEMLLLSWGNVS